MFLANVYELGLKVKQMGLHKCNLILVNPLITSWPVEYHRSVNHCDSPWLGMEDNTGRNTGCEHLETTHK